MIIFSASKTTISPTLGPSRIDLTDMTSSSHTCSSLSNGCSVGSGDENVNVAILFIFQTINAASAAFCYYIETKEWTD